MACNGCDALGPPGRTAEEALAKYVHRAGHPHHIGEVLAYLQVIVACRCNPQPQHAERLGSHHAIECPRYQQDDRDDITRPYGADT
jgi:hypothetical protein